MEFVICINNQNYTASLEVKKIYQVIPDKSASLHHMIRVIDESGEDYLYPQNYFMSVELSEAIIQAIATVN
ncbi:hypothetical protein M595_4537 [Lyngbya aestuarii BL J]|uniref:Uncharacterized protein n=1 Tax=Lyngbya aestuarii BL J TaxID=1348334 RepID=U7QEK7_9CYAN|nr:hypothetical protein [Lyngbya aestuarii]ERT05495.1 hypothetical protein M595_4537 [Lyngbya aestuarii BL J]